MAPHPITEGSKNSDAGVAGALLTRLDPATCSPLARDAATLSTAAENRILCVPSADLPTDSNAERSGRSGHTLRHSADHVPLRARVCTSRASARLRVVAGERPVRRAPTAR